MKTKVVFPNRIDGKFCICPFQGYTVSNLEDFKEVIRKYFDKETGYPGLFFKTAHKNLRVVFAGHQYVHGPEGRWAIFDTAEDEWPKQWFSLSDNAEKVLELFDDKEDMDKKIEMITKIVNVQGGITLEVG